MTSSNDSGRQLSSGLREKVCLSPFLYATSLMMAVTAGAQFEEPPTITTTAIERTVHADVGADGAECLPPIAETSSAEAGSFDFSASVACTGKFLSHGDGKADQDTQISSYSISGTGEINAAATVGGLDPNAWVTLNAYSMLSVQFTVPVDTVFGLSGNFEITVGEDPDGTCGEDTGGWVFLFGTDTNGQSFLFDQKFNCLDPPEQANFSHFDTLKANTPAQLFIYIGSGVMGVIGGESPDLGDRFASFDFSFDLGDRDGDGLLDLWEIEGIDIDGDGQPEIDLPAEGADPDKKDLFVEVDVMSGVGFDQQAIDDVIRAFAEAPAAMVNNPDGSKGIHLHVIRDGDRPTNEPLALTPSDDLPPEYYSIKDSFFGSEDDRNHPNWDDIRRARLLAYRYCLWADTLIDSDTDPLYGVAEGIPSNDFIVADRPIVEDFPDILRENRASTFMHELGHTLGLGHGGQNDENNKPNYLSIMNYAYVSPWNIITAQGTNVADYWRLDFSRRAMIDLDETKLDEAKSLQGPAGRVVFYNSAAETDPEPVVRAISRANRPTMNWNRNSEDPEPATYQLDISRNDGDDDPHYDSTLESFTDWNRIWYHLTGTEDFNDRERWPFAEPADGMDVNTIRAFYNVEWIDTTVLDDLIFENGFDLGSTTAWSETVP